VYAAKIMIGHGDDAQWRLAHRPGFVVLQISSTTRRLKMPEKSATATLQNSAATERFASPVVYELAGGGVAISYFPKSGGGPASFTYHDSHRTENFVGDQIRTTAIPDLGSVVSVTIVPTVDRGSTSFSVLIPDINLPNRPGASTPVFTDGITTVHKFSIPPSQGQSETYTVTPLLGTASLA